MSSSKEENSGCGTAIAALIVLALIIIAVMWSLSLVGHALGITPTYHEVMNRDKQWLHEHYPNVGWRYIVTAVLIISTVVGVIWAATKLRANPDAWQHLRWSHAGMAALSVIVLVVAIRATIGTPSYTAATASSAAGRTAGTSSTNPPQSVDPFAAASRHVRADHYAAALEEDLTARQSRRIERKISRRLAARARYALNQRNRPRARFLLRKGRSYLSTPEFRNVSSRFKATAAQKKPTPQPKPVSNCDENYSGGCVPNDQGDVDCTQLSVSDLQVVGSDVYALDRDGDGLACES